MQIRKILGCLAVYALSAIAAQAQAPKYDEPFRPQVHFSPATNWTNDPNGLLYYRGEYHLFFQYNPFGDQWGHMSWGHAVSPDMLHWKELPVAIAEQDGVMIFTGSIVVDHANTSGLCGAGKECLVAVYTGHSEKDKATLQTQNIASSVDNGRTWTRYKGNPVLDLHMADFRDPSVSWDEIGRHWLMAVSLPKEHKVRFYGSPNLKDWTQLSEFGPAGDVDGDWECPDLLRVPAAKGTGSIWALKVGLNPGAPQGGSGEQYFLGDFDGTKFTQSKERGSQGWTNYGKDDYCAISFNGLPKGDKPALLGWMSNWQYAAKLPTSPWRGQMSLPRRLSFVNDTAGMGLRQEPVVAPLRNKAVVVVKATDSVATEAPFELHLTFAPMAGKVSGVKLYSDAEHFTEIGFDGAKKEFYIDRTHAGGEISADFPARTVAPLNMERTLDLTLVVDRSSVEAYAQNGTIAMTDLIFPAGTGVKVEVFPKDAAPLKEPGQLWRLKSIWK
jgi:fructan beta-fructosidase